VSTIPTLERPTRAETSRINGAKSKGPITAEGKQKSTRNSSSHGLYAERIVLPNEDPAHFAELLNSYLETYCPTDPVEEVMVGRIATMDWKFKRLLQLESACCADVMQETHILISTIEKFSKLQHTAERALTRAHKDLFEHRREKRLRDKTGNEKTNPSYLPIPCDSFRAIPSADLKNAETNPTILNKNSENEPKEKSAETNPTNLNSRPAIHNPQETNPATQNINREDEPREKIADTNPRNLTKCAPSKNLSQAEQILIGGFVEARIKSLGYKPSEREVELIFEECVDKLMASYARVDAEEMLKTKRPSGIKGVKKHFAIALT
jgi:hypothetical protein